MSLGLLVLPGWRWRRGFVVAVGTDLGPILRRCNGTRRREVPADVDDLLVPRIAFFGGKFKLGLFGAGVDVDDVVLRALGGAAAVVGVCLPLPVKMFGRAPV